MGLWNIPAVVLAFLAWFTGPPTSLMDVARREALRREVSASPAHRYTNQDLPAAETPAAPVAPPPPVVNSGDEAPAVAAVAAPVVTPATPADASKTPETHDEAWWHQRITTARTTLDRDQVLADALQSRINGLTTDFINRDDPVQKQQFFDQRQKALAELDTLQKQLVVDAKAIEDVLEDARKQAVPPGWLRDGSGGSGELERTSFSR